jgi:hypothetical protein
MAAGRGPCRGQDVILDAGWSSKKPGGSWRRVDRVGTVHCWKMPSAVRRPYSAAWEGAAPLRSRGVHLSPQPRPRLPNSYQTTINPLLSNRTPSKEASFGSST